MDPIIASPPAPLTSNDVVSEQHIRTWALNPSWGDSYLSNVCPCDMILIASTWTEKEVDNHAQMLHMLSALDAGLIKRLLDSFSVGLPSGSSNPFSDGYLSILVRKAAHMEYIKGLIPGSCKGTCIFRIVPDIHNHIALQNAMKDADIVIYSQQLPFLRPKATESQLVIIDAAAAAGVGHFMLNSWLNPFRCQCDPRLNALGTIPEDHLGASGLSYTILQLAHPVNLSLRSFLGTDYIGYTHSLSRKHSYLDQQDAIAAILEVMKDPKLYHNTRYALVSCACTTEDIIEGFHARTTIRLEGIQVTFDDQISRMREIDAGLGAWFAAVATEYPSLKSPCCDYKKTPDEYGNPEILCALIGRKPRSVVDNIVERRERGYSPSAIRLSRIIRQYFQSKLGPPNEQGSSKSESKFLKRDSAAANEKRII